VTLTPEEKRRIAEEEKVRFKTQNKLKSRQQTRRALGCFALILLFWSPLLFWVMSKDQEPIQYESQQDPPQGISVQFLSPPNLAVTKGSGWTVEAVKNYIWLLKDAREKRELGRLGIPPTTPAGSRGAYAAGAIWLFSVGLPRDRLVEFAEMNDPGWSLVTPLIKGSYLWSIFGDDEGIIGFKDGLNGTEYNNYQVLFEMRPR